MNARARMCLAAAVAVVAGIGGLALGLLLPDSGASSSATLPSTSPTAVPKAQCQPGDKVETGLQGQVPVVDRVSGRAAQGYNCNLVVVSNWGSKVSDPRQPTTGWANFEVFDHCAYFGDTDDDLGGNYGSPGTVVLDVSDSANPVQTAYLTTPGMTGPWESLRANLKRRLLVADNNADPYLDIYDVSQDCAHPTLLSTVSLPTAIGHEGWFSPDGNTYWVSRLGTVVPVDISDPQNPQELGNWPAAHGGSSSDDGTRQYFCQSGNPDKLLTLDSSDIQFRIPNPQPRTVSSLDLVDNSICQQTYPVTYGGRPYVIQFGESAPNGGGTGTQCPYNPYTNFSHPRIVDMSDEAKPVVVTEILTEVDLPSNCNAINGDKNHSINPAGAVVTSLFLYGTHQCTPDRLHDPTILACAEFSSGLRVYDIRDPLNPRELAYFNPGTRTVGDTTVDQAASRPVVKATRGEIWFSSFFHGFYVLKFENGVYPFANSLTCAATFDYLFAQYNPDTTCGRPTAVTVRRFAARWRGLTVRVAWTTASETDVAGFNVYRKAGHGPFRKLNSALIQARRAGAAYRLVDRRVRRSQLYVYRLQLVDKAGRRSWYGVGATAS